ncbi:Gat2 protein [Saccharomycopsis crataegensis]|uniref:Gat2 protein n=1 Tax=Saccharomycopsis crataegensis TaxID=43959 RepID=A0AAV5QU01_9ASCO|nr:Gat2 protein [Saccharomycopsis crataegensis]
MSDTSRKKPIKLPSFNELESSALLSKGGDPKSSRNRNLSTIATGFGDYRFSTARQPHQSNDKDPEVMISYTFDPQVPVKTAASSQLEYPSLPSSNPSNDGTLRIGPYHSKAVSIGGNVTATKPGFLGPEYQPQPPPINRQAPEFIPSLAQSTEHSSIPLPSRCYQQQFTNKRQKSIQLPAGNCTLADPNEEKVKVFRSIEASISSFQLLSGMMNDINKDFLNIVNDRNFEPTTYHDNLLTTGGRLGKQPLIADSKIQEFLSKIPVEVLESLIDSADRFTRGLTTWKSYQENQSPHPQYRNTQLKREQKYKQEALLHAKQQYLPQPTVISSSVRKSQPSSGFSANAPPPPPPSVSVSQQHVDTPNYSYHHQNPHQNPMFTVERQAPVTMNLSSMEFAPEPTSSRPPFLAKKKLDSSKKQESNANKRNPKRSNSSGNIGVSGGGGSTKKHSIVNNKRKHSSDSHTTVSNSDTRRASGGTSEMITLRVKPSKLMNPEKATMSIQPPSKRAQGQLHPELSVKHELVCMQCGRKDTPEWRRGPDGARTLCNACGLFHSKLHKKMGPEKADDYLRGLRENGNNGFRRLPK